jgi:two-component system, NarL family, response regulator NreC
MSKLRLVLADDHGLVRHGLRKILEERPDWEVVAEAGDGRDAVALALEHRPDVIVMDIGMPLLNGIDATRQITHRWPDARVLMLSMHKDEPYVARAFQAGVTGYLLKDSVGADLLGAVETVAKGLPYFSPEIAQKMVADYVRRLDGGPTADPYESLSEREREIFQLIAEAYSNKDIATILGISPATVETHRARVLQKLDIHNAAEVVLYAVRRGIIS